MWLISAELKLHYIGVLCHWEQHVEPVRKEKVKYKNTNSNENSKPKVPYQMAKSKLKHIMDQWKTTVIFLIYRVEQSSVFFVSICVQISNNKQY